MRTAGRSSRVPDSRRSASAAWPSCRCSERRRPSRTRPTARRPTRRRAPSRLVISNWPDYIDPINHKASTVKEFESATGITVHYTDDVSDNAEFFAKVRNQLGACQTIGRDMMVLTDWMAARMINLGWVQPIDRERHPQPPQEPDPGPAGPAVGPAPQVLGALAERPDRDRVQREEDQGGPQLRGADHPARPQGPDHPALRDARHDGVHAQDHRRRPGQVHRRRVEQGHREARGRGQGRAGARLHRQRVHPGPDRGQHRWPARRGPAT